jgi:hypothetical protein
VCGETGGSLPISPISLDFNSLKNFVPRLPEVPYIKQLLSWSGLGDGLSYVGDSLKCYIANRCESGTGKNEATPLPEGCRWTCPFGWYSFGDTPASQCYLLPEHEIFLRKGLASRRETFETAKLKCSRTEASSYVMVINSLTELAQVELILKTFKWDQANDGAHLWLGAYTDDSQWNYLDGSASKGNLLISMANLPSRKDGTYSKGTCLAADLRDGGHWRQQPCNSPNGLYLCEMARKQTCSGIKGGNSFNFTSPVDMTLPHWKQVFPSMPEMPFLDEVLEGKGRLTIDPKRGGMAHVMCVKLGTGWTSKPDWDYLYVDGVKGSAPGEWVRHPCGSSGVPEYSFKTSATTALGAWSRCYNKGYELAMPVWYASSFSAANTVLNALDDGWYAFQVDNQIAEFYSKPASSIWNLGGVASSYKKHPHTTTDKC